MTKKPMKQNAEKGRPMEMRELKAPYGTLLYAYTHKRATEPLPIEPPTDGGLKEAFSQLATALAGVNTVVSRISRMLK